MDRVEHLDETVLECYAMGRLKETEAEAVEDHISLCATCLDRLDETTVYVRTMQNALGDWRVNPSQANWRSRFFDWVKIPIPALAAALAVLLLTVFAVSRRSAPFVPATVLLGSTHGSSAVVHTNGPFTFELPILTSWRRCRVTLLNDSGVTLWEKEVSGKDGKLQVPFDEKLPDGAYYFHVADLASNSVKEYGLKIRR